MGEVWRAWDRENERYLAAKLLRPEFVQDPEIVTRFLQERSILISLDHPNIVQVRDLVVEGDDLAIVMDLVRGGSLGDYLKDAGTLAPAVAVPLVAALLDALAYAHGRGVLHRDIKPDNALLADQGLPTPATVRLTDFGIARLTQEGSIVQASGLIGTPLYMPPELFEYGQFSAKSDVYATGIVLYELLAGRTPFAGSGTPLTIGNRHVRSAPPTLPLHPALWQVLSTLLAKDPAHRPSAAEAAEQLRRITGLDINPLPVQPVPEQWSDSHSLLPGKDTLGRADTSAATIGSVQDPNATWMKAGAQPATVPVVTDSMEEFDPSRTQVKAAVHHEVKASLPATEPSLPNKRRRLLLAIGAGVGVLAIAFLVLWLTGVFPTRTPADPPPTTTVTAAPDWLRGKAAPSGLSLDWSASYNAADATTKVELTLYAPRSIGLSGEVLFVLPAFNGDACAELIEQPETMTRLTASGDGTDADCGYKLTDVSLTAGQEQRFVITVAGGPEDSYGPWLTAITQATDEVLRSLTGTSFPLQRVTGLTVQASSIVLNQGGGIGQNVPYSVVARWLGDQSAVPDFTLFTSDTLITMETDQLKDLTGGVGLNAVEVTTCDAAENATGQRLRAIQPTNSCSLTVRIGELVGQGTFSIDLYS
jgi:serine/threonine-protein kinase